MPDKGKKFHEFAIQSLLFKGRADWYFCFLKAEKIAQVLSFLVPISSIKEEDVLNELLGRAAHLPQEIAHFAAGEADASFVLADIFSLLSATRLAVARGALSSENGTLLVQEYERMAEKLNGGGQISPFVSVDSFALPEMPSQDSLVPFSTLAIAQSDKENVKDISGQNKRQNDRASEILEIIRKNGPVSIKDISKVVKGCSEKTIQRELISLIGQGRVAKEGERRWSTYTYIR